MKITETMLEIVKNAFPNLPVETESDGEQERILIDMFLSIEPTPVTVKSILTTKSVPGWLATLDNGEDAQELYKGTNFWEALSSVAQEHAKFRVRCLQDKYDPCLIPTK